MDSEILDLREKINEIDDKIFGLLEKRFKIIKIIREYKRKNNLELKNSQREMDLIEREIKKSRFSEIFIKDIYDLIFKESLRIENE